VQYPYDIDFQTSVLRFAFSDPQFADLAHAVVEPEFFEREVDAWLFRHLEDGLEQYGQTFTLAELQTEAVAAARAGEIDPGDVKLYAEAVKGAFSNPLHSRQFVLDRIVRFGRQEAVKRFMKDRGLDCIRNEAYEDLVVGLDEARALGQDFGDMGMFYFPDTEEALQRRAVITSTSAVHTGITELDECFAHHGVGRGEMIIWMGPSNRGKSMAMSQHARRAVFTGLKAVHFSLEMSEDDVRERYDAALAGIAMRDLVREEHAVKAKVDKLGATFGNVLNIKEFPAGRATVSMLRNHIRNLIRMGWGTPDLIVVDYGDLLRPEVRRKEKREELSDIFTDLKGLGTEFQAAMCTGTQANRAAFQKEVVSMEDVAEDIGKMMIADMVIGLCQTREEYLQGVMRLCVAKNRKEKHGHEIKIFQDLSKGVFYQKMFQIQV